MGDRAEVATLAARLRAWGTGPEAREAVAQLIAGGWLADPALVAACVVPIQGDPTVAVIDWAGLAQHARRLEAGGDARAGELWVIHGVAARAWGGSVPDGEAER